MRAIDATGNLERYSNTATATTPAAADTQPPTAPGTLAATAVSATEINLAWGAATDNVGVTGYRVERCRGRLHQLRPDRDAGDRHELQRHRPAAATSYSYRVRATDAAANSSGYSQHRDRHDHRPQPRPGCGLRLRRGFGDNGRGRVGERQHRHDREPTWAATGKYGKALQFNGTSARVTVPDAARCTSRAG